MDRFLSFLILASAIFAQSAFAETCDVNADGDLDLNDINLVMAARNTPPADLFTAPVVI